MSWLLLWEIIFSADFIYSLSVPGGHDHINAYALLILFNAFVCISVVYCSRILAGLYPDLVLFIDHNPVDLKNWYEAKLKHCYAGIWPLIAGALFVLIEELTIGSTIHAFTPPDPILQWFRAGYGIIGFFFLGISLWALVNVLMIPIQMMAFKVKINLNQLSGRGLLALGSAFFKMSIAITACFILIVLAGILAGLINNYAVLVWEGLGVLLIFGFFLVPQVGIHQLMSHEKEQRILSLSPHLESALEKSLKEPSSENMQRLKELFELQGHLKNMNEWPFNMNTIWQLITALLIPIGLALLDIIF